MKAYTELGEPIILNKLWERRQCTKFNGASYVIQRGAEATYTQEGRKQVSLIYFLLHNPAPLTTVKIFIFEDSLSPYMHS